MNQSCTVQYALDSIRELCPSARRLLVTLDGPCATGKTTLAALLSEALAAPVIHTDDFVIPHGQKTPERLALPGGNCDAERLEAEVLIPFKQGKSLRFRRYDCRSGRFEDPEELPAPEILILEGSYCNLPVLRRHADLCLFLTASREVRENRLRERESPESLKRFHELWIPLEDAYFSAFHLPDDQCLVLDGGRPLS